MRCNDRELRLLLLFGSGEVGVLMFRFRNKRFPWLFHCGVKVVSSDYSSMFYRTSLTQILAKLMEGQLGRIAKRIIVALSSVLQSSVSSTLVAKKPSQGS